MESKSKEFEILELIGEGSFGKVYKARWIPANRYVAYKIISKSGRRSTEVTALRRECEIQKGLEHPNIIRMLHSFETEQQLVVIAEFASIDLSKVLVALGGTIDENRVSAIISDLVSALYYLHSNRILHRDLKPHNVLINENGVAKLCDFGFARILVTGQMLQSIKGTPLYMAPELMNENPYDHNADLWSLGCIGYELLVGKAPFWSSSILQLIKMIRLQPVKWPTNLSPSCHSILQGLLQKNPSVRLTWPQLLYHPFLQPHRIFQFQPFPSYQLSHPYAVGNVQQNSNYHEFYHHQVTNKFTTDCKGTSLETFPMHYYGPEKMMSSNSTDTQDRLKVSPTSKRTRFMCSIKKQLRERPLDEETQEWLDFLKKITHDVLIKEIDVLLESHSLKLLLKPLSNPKISSQVLQAVSKLLCLPFVLPSISDETELLLIIRHTYLECDVPKHLVEAMWSLMEPFDILEKDAIEKCLILLCNLIYTDENDGQIFLKSFFESYLNSENSSDRVHVMKRFLAANNTQIPFYLISIFVRLLIKPLASQFFHSAIGFVVELFFSSITELHKLLNNANKDIILGNRICLFITLIFPYINGHKKSSSLEKSNLKDSEQSIEILITDLDRLNENTDIPNNLRLMVHSTLARMNQYRFDC